MAAHIWCRYTHTHTHTICKKGCILIEYLVHLFVHVLVSLESSLCFSWLLSGFQKEEGEERKQTPEIIYHLIRFCRLLCSFVVCEWQFLFCNVATVMDTDCQCKCNVT